MSNKNKKKRNWPFVLLFIVGFLILIYPQISRLYYRIDSKNLNETYEESIKEMDALEIERRMELAKAFNASLVNDVKDPYSEEKKEEGKKEYAHMLEVNEMIGHIKIPKINADIPTYAGTNDEVLEKGAGHLEGTSLPIGGDNSHAVITAHSGLPKAKLFTDLDELEIGDTFYFKNINETLAYKVDRIRVVEPTDFNDLLIQKGHDYMTLLTCTPIMVNSHRLLVRGHRIPYNKRDEDRLNKEALKNLILRMIFYLVLIIIGILLILNIRYIKKKRFYLKKIDEFKDMGGDTNE